MHKPIWEDREFKIIRANRDYILIRKDFPYKYHAHFKKLYGCHLIINLYHKKLIPYQRYFRGSIKRLTTDEEYNNFTNQKPKPKYRNVR